MLLSKLASVVGLESAHIFQETYNCLNPTDGFKVFGDCEMDLDSNCPLFSLHCFPPWNWQLSLDVGIYLISLVLRSVRCSDEHSFLFFDRVSLQSLGWLQTEESSCLGLLSDPLFCMGTFIATAVLVIVV